MSKFEYPINIPFAQNGDKNVIPDTSSTDLINKSQGFTSRYSTPPADGGAYITREDFNGLIFETQRAIKELQDLVVTTISGNKPDVNGNIDIDLTNYFNKDTDKLNLTSQVEDVLLVANGGTGKDNLSNIQNTYYTGELYKFNFTSGTIKELLEKLPDHFEGTFLYVGKSIITDFPFSVNSGNIKIIKLNKFLQASTVLVFRENSFETWQVYFSYPDFNAVWKKTRNADGTIPASCGGVLTKYENSYGTWTETLLETGEIMLEGFGKSSLMRNSDYNTFETTIQLPKRINILKSSLTASTEVLSAYLRSMGSVLSTNAGNQQLHMSITFTEDISIPYVSVYWYFRGILSQ